MSSGHESHLRDSLRVAMSTSDADSREPPTLTDSGSERLPAQSGHYWEIGAS
jgi:hypothetical protein